MLEMRLLLSGISDGFLKEALNLKVSSADGILLAEEGQMLSENFFYMAEPESVSSLTAPANGRAIVFAADAESAGSWIRNTCALFQRSSRPKSFIIS